MSQIGDKLLGELIATGLLKSGDEGVAAPVVEKAIRLASRDAFDEARTVCVISRGMANPHGYLDKWFTAAIMKYGVRSTD
jgi:hypothetical protein